MSLFALYKNGGAAARERADDALSGNLCRCTGYRPILAAAQRMGELPAAEGWRGPRDGPGVAQAEQALAERLAALARPAGLDYEAAGQRWIAPADEAALAAACAAHPGRADRRRRDRRRPVGDQAAPRPRRRSSTTGDVAELARIERTAEGLAIGAAATLADAFAALDADYPELHEAWVRFASVPIRNTGTLGGNVANGSPIGDSMPALIALGARGGPAPRQRAAHAAARGLLRRLPARRRACPANGSRASSCRRRREGLAAARVEDEQALRPGHLGGLRVLRAAHRRTAASRRRASAAAAWRHVPARARRTEAALVGQPWTAASGGARGRACSPASSRPSTTCAPPPRTGARRSAT